MALPIPNLNLNTKASSEAKSRVASSFEKNGLNVNYGAQNTVPWYVIAAVGVALLVLVKHRKG